MRTAAKVGWVVAGYVGAFLVAYAIVAAYAAGTTTPGRQASGGMSAFGDSLLFLGLFGVSAVPATGAGLYFLRPHRPFWRALSVAALVVAATGLAASIEFLVARTADGGSALHAWSPYAVLRILVAPIFALVFLLAALFAPNRPSRIALAGAAAIEAAGFASVALTWFRAF